MSGYTAFHRLSTAVLVLGAWALAACGDDDADRTPWPNDLIAFAGNCAEGLYVANSDGTDVRKLVEGTVNDDDPAISPDRKQVAYGAVSLMVVDAAGGPPRELANAGAPAYRAIWSPEGRHILFHATLSVGPTVQVAAADGSSLRNVAVGMHLGWAPDSASVTYDVQTPDSHNIYVAPIDGGQPTLLFNITGDAYNRAISPDLMWLAYITSEDPSGRTPNPEFTLWLTSRDGATSEVAKGHLQWTLLAWSPDGTKLAFANVGPQGSESQEFVSPYEILVFEPDGNDEPRAIASGKAHSFGGPFSDRLVWTQDSSVVIFEADGTWAARADGSGARMIFPPREECED